MAIGLEREHLSAIKWQGKSTRSIKKFIVKGLEAGKLEYRYSSVWGCPFIRVLRRQLEEYITAELGSEYLIKAKGETELKKIKKEMAELEEKLTGLQAKRAEIERVLSKKRK